MLKKKMTLEEAKEKMEIDRIFYNGGDKFNVLDIGKYRSGITIEIPQEWDIDEYRRPVNPIEYIDVKKLTDGMNIYFDGKAQILLGKYRVSQKGKPVFELTKPTEATDTLIRVDWGGSFNSSRGQDNEYAKEVGASFFTRRSSNGGGTGFDYWVIPVNFVKDRESRDVSKILEEVERKQNEKREKIEEIITKQDLERKESIENKDRIMEKVRPIIEELESLDFGFEYEAQEESFSYKESSYRSYEKVRYSEEMVNELLNVLEEMKDKKISRDLYLPLFKEMEDVAKSLNIKIQYGDRYASVIMPNSYSSVTCYYDENGYDSFIKSITEYQKKLETLKEEARRKAAELKMKEELKRKKEDAKEKGYPEIFEFYNRLSGATGLSHAYVIESDGMIREPDYNILNNHNHVFKYSDWKNEADGKQGYEQILPGEIIVTYTKDYTAVPYIINVEWADSEITEGQLDVICQELEEKLSFAATTEMEDIKDFREWIRNEVKLKSLECKKQLNTEKEEDIKEDSYDEKTIDEISNLAQEKEKEEDKNQQANQLVQAYEKEVLKKTDKKSLEEK